MKQDKDTMQLKAIAITSGVAFIIGFIAGWGCFR